MRLFLILLMTAIYGLAGTPSRAARKPSAPAPAAVPDSVLEQKIREKFAKSKISTNNFQVKVQGGVATIEGRAGIIQHKGTATRLAKSAGAKHVVNKIQITDEARQKAAANLEKGRRRGQQNRTEPVKRAEVSVKGVYHSETSR